MFSRVRWRLLGWNTLVFVLLLALIGGTVYFSLARSLRAELDRNLANGSNQAAQQIHEMNEHGGRFAPEGYRGGLFFVLIGQNGSTLANPQDVDVGPLPTLKPGETTPRFATIMLGTDATRLYLQPVSGPRLPPGTLIVGESTRPQREALTRLLIILIAGGGFGLLLVLAGAWFLAGRALVPIQQAFARQQEFVADAAHELRTPLTILRSATDLLQQHQDESLAQNAELFTDVRDEIGRMERLTHELLTLARSDRQALELAVGEVDVAALIAETVRRMQPIAEQHGIMLTTEGGDVPLTIEADPDRFQQVLMILLDNALAHTPSGGNVTASVRRDGRDAVLAIRDTGEGIPAEHLPRIFDRFYRVDRSRTRDRGGTGLGLAIAQALAQAHGGQLTLSSAPGTGTVATVRVPAIGRTRAPRSPLHRAHPVPVDHHAGP
jgi:signal transduction histidine kinase